MVAFRDWPRTMRPASFRGVPFYVERDQVETGRRLAIHEFPLKDAPYVEDMGRETNKISVTAYVLGDDADSQEKALRDACDQGGVGALSLPIDRFEVHCESCSRDFSKDKLGLIAFNLKFVREGAGPAGGRAGLVMPPGFLAAQIGLVALDVVSAVAAWLSAAVAVAGQSSLVRDAAARDLRAIAGEIDAAARGVTMDPALGARVTRTLIDIDRNAESLVRIGALPHAITATVFSAARQETSAAANLTATLRQVLDDLRLAIPPDSGAVLLAGIATYEALPPPITPRTHSRRQAQANAVALAQALRLVALAGYAEALAARTFADRRAAIQARADTTEYFAAELDRIEPGPGSAELHRAVVTLSGRVAEYISRLASDLAPVMVVEANVAMPALWWANRLYGDADRAGDIVARNRVIHASFLPLRIEALAR